MKFSYFQVFLRSFAIWVGPGTSKPSIFLQEYQPFQHGAARSPPSRSKSDFHQKSTKITGIWDNSIKMEEFTEINGILLISRLRWSQAVYVYTCSLCLCYMYAIYNLGLSYICIQPWPRLYIQSLGLAYIQPRPRLYIYIYIYIQPRPRLYISIYIYSLGLGYTHIAQAQAIYVYSLGLGCTYRAQGYIYLQPRPSLYITQAQAIHIYI